ncbi:MAG: class I SAM-dependent methyltransferase [Gloeomargaritaceae cyanobacterium C42_A2020_066]|nr:class I SAM-dependent methyltransferase [Gloeomargaritaceae cyanobacterium C42_A2020_066]
MASATLDSLRPAVRLVNFCLGIKPLAAAAKHQARTMMINRAEQIGVPWRQRAAELQARDWTEEFQRVHNPDVTYPDYYLKPFHAYDQGNLCWQAATEAEVAAYAVHARIWPAAGRQGDAQLRQSYHDLLLQHLPTAPRAILDVGCSVGMSSFALQRVYPEAQITGLDLSPHFLAVAQYQSQQQGAAIRWVHRPAEATQLPDESFDLVSLFLICHELPHPATASILQEARRLLRPGGHLALMDMNPQSTVHATMPPYILTLLKSTEPYLDDYFTLDLPGLITAGGFQSPRLVANSPRHRTLIAQIVT